MALRRWLEDVPGCKRRQGAGVLSRAGGPAHEVLDVGTAAVVSACTSVVIRHARRLRVLPGDNIASVLAARSCRANRAVILLKRYILMG